MNKKKTKKIISEREERTCSKSRCDESDMEVFENRSAVYKDIYEQHKRKKLNIDDHHSRDLGQVLRVDHAGEYGAKQIYSGQLAIFKKRKFFPSFIQKQLANSEEENQKTIELLEHMKEQEDEHFDYFDKKIVAEKVRPTLMQPIWKIAGFALGAGTALMGKKAAMACTVAVEEVIDQHYQEQLESLKDAKENKELKEKIEKFRQEELEHRDIGLENEAEDLKIYNPLTFLIKNASKAAIFISKKI